MMRFQTSRTDQDVFDELEGLCGSSGYIHVLAAISMRDNFVTHSGQMTSEALAASYSPERTVRTEFSTLIGLLLKHEIEFTLPAPEEMQRMIDRTHELLEELHACFNQSMIAVLKKAAAEVQAGLSIKEATPFLQGGVLREAIFYGGESAYNFQYRDFSIERYAADDEWLLANKGFRIADGRAVADAMSELANRKLMAVVNNLTAVPSSEWTLLPGFTFSLEEISAAAAVSPQVTESVLSAFTAPSAPTNADFKTTGDFNIANAYPILRTPTGEYISLQGYGLFEALYDSPYYWMVADKAYKNTAAKHRGTFTEEFVAKRLSTVFGEANVHRGVNVLNKGDHVSEIDVLVIFADRAIVAQCKSKKLTLEARKGNDSHVRGDFKKAVQDAYDQAYLCAKSLSNPALKFVRADGKEVTIPSLREIYPLCVVSDHYPALAAQVREFLTFKTDDVIHPPFVGDVFLIDVLAEILSSPLRLLSYINRRVGYVGRLNSVNELTILGYHLQQNLWFEDEASLFTVSEEFSIPLDTAMTVRRLGVPGERTPTGILTKLEGTLIGRLVKSIESRADTTLIDLGFLILSLSGDTLDDLDRGLKHISEQTRKDGKDHDLTLAFNDNRSGLTIHCNMLPNALAADHLTDHCRRRKYVHRADSWFGLVVRADDGIPKFGIQLRFPWKRDSTLEEETKGMAYTSAKHLQAAARVASKVGRNEPCPCGSGKKFKRCCLR